MSYCKSLFTITLLIELSELVSILKLTIFFDEKLNISGYKSPEYICEFLKKILKAAVAPPLKVPSSNIFNFSFLILLKYLS